VARTFFSFLPVIATTLGLLLPFRLTAQQPAATQQLQTVEVFGKPAEVYAVGSRVTTVDSSFLSTYAGGTLAEALQARTPAYFKSYGVSGVSSVSFRGTNAAQTAVLWNGLNIALPTLGQSDFSTLPLGSIGDVAVQHGPAGPAYGSGAIGGAVLLSSPDYKGKGLGAMLQQEAGSFGRYYSSGSISYANSSFRAGTSAYVRIAENNFPYKDLSRFGQPERKEEHARQQCYGFTQDLTWRLRPQTQLSLHAWYADADRKLQSAMGSAANQAAQHDQNLRLMSALQHSSRWGKSDIKLAYFKDYLHYGDISTSSEVDVQTYQLQAEQTYTRGSRWSLRGGLNLQHFVADNDGYTGTRTEQRAAAFALFRYNPLQALDLSLNLRHTLVPGYNPLPSPALGFNWKFYNINRHQLSLKGSASGSYRVPTLNDRFWAGAGNPHLRPEQGWSYEGGLRHLLVLGNTLLLETEATAYHMRVDDWIQWAPDDKDRWRPVNLQQVRAMGLELSHRATTTLGEVALTASAAYTYTSSEQVKVYEGRGDLHKQLMYVPLHKALLSTEATYKGWRLLSNLNYTGLRYTTNSETAYLEGFLLLNLALSKKIPIQQNTLWVALRADNVTNQVYQTMAYRAMPLRSYTFSLRFTIP